MTRLPARAHLPAAIVLAVVLALGGYLISRSPAAAPDTAPASSVGPAPTTDEVAVTRAGPSAEPEVAPPAEVGGAAVTEEPVLPEPGGPSTSSGSSGDDVPHADLAVLEGLDAPVHALVADGSAVYAVLDDGTRVRADDRG